MKALSQSDYQRMINQIQYDYMDEKSSVKQEASFVEPAAIKPSKPPSG
jgi:hypothetical protein